MIPAVFFHLYFDYFERNDYLYYVTLVLNVNFTFEATVMRIYVNLSIYLYAIASRTNHDIDFTVILHNAGLYNIEYLKYTALLMVWPFEDGGLSFH